MVEAPSPSGSEAAAVAALQRGLAERAVRTRVDAAGNLHVRAGTGPKRLLLLGHVDTVPGALPVRDDGDTLHGRGTVDAKGPLCAAAAALADLAESDAIGGDWTVHLVAAVGEEAPGSPGATRLLHDLDAPDAMIVLEPSGWDAVTLGYKGHLRARLTCERPSAHAAGPDPSAGDRLVRTVARLLDEIDRSEPADEGAFARLTATVTDLRHQHDGVTARASATLGVRLPVHRPPDAAGAWLRERLEGSGVRMQVDDGVAAVRGPADGPLTRAFRVAIRTAGGRPRRIVKTGTSDWNVVARRWAVPALAYGPGDSALDHAPNERIAWSEVDAATYVLRTAIARITANGVA
ncbi:MAG: M20/M25/M40 family metallo-hydrolase [Trueperaceae bacterium]